jgi:hypothetical protein
MQKAFLIAIGALMCVLAACAIFVYDDDQPTAPQKPDTTTIVIVK